MTLRYDPNDVIGKGGFGIVFRGFYFHSTPVAAKRIQKATLNYVKVREEVELMKKAKGHRNVLHYIDIEIDNEFLYIITELCSGNLEHYVTGNGYKGPRFQNDKDILFQITQGLGHLHRLNIVHRDLKPANILVYVPTFDNGNEQKSPLVKLADFGISKALNADKEDFTNTSVTNPRGTRGWMAPEVYESKRFNFKVDIWSLGLIHGYVLSEGKHPFGGDREEWAFLIKNKKPMKMVRSDLKEPYSSENNEAFDLIESMLAMDPDERPTVEDIKQHNFFRDNRQQLLETILTSFEENFPRIDVRTTIDELEQLLTDDSININVQLDSGATLLHVLFRYYKEDNLIDFVQFSVSRLGAHITVTDEQFGTTLLHELCINYPHENVIDILQFLIKEGAEVNAKDVNGWNPLHTVCCNYKNVNLKEIVQLLIENGVDVNAKDKNGNTPLFIVCEYYNNNKIMKQCQSMIMKDGECAKDKHGFSPNHELYGKYEKENLEDILKLAKSEETNYNSTFIDNNLINIVEVLLENGAVADVKNKNGDTPLHELCHNYDKDNLINIVKLMIQKGARVDEKNNAGSTPLHVLCCCYQVNSLPKEDEKFASLVQLFEDNGTSMTEKDNKGKTPQDFYIHRKKSVLAMLDTLKRKNIQVKEGEEYDGGFINFLNVFLSEQQPSEPLSLGKSASPRRPHQLNNPVLVPAEQSVPYNSPYFPPLYNFSGPAPVYFMTSAPLYLPMAGGGWQLVGTQYYLIIDDQIMATYISPQVPPSGT